MPTEVEARCIEEFRKTPIGHHSPELQVILNELRGTPMENKYCLICTKPNREWQLAMTTGVRGKPVKTLNQKFTSLEEAEWYVFKKRWKQLRGETIR
jgi:N,N-dimethylformamidase